MRFKEWINNFCENFDEYQEEISKLISNNIQILKAV